jgi:hypothetical protein
MVTDSPEARRLRRAWIEAGKAVAKDSAARVTCPSCGRGVLIVRDELAVGGTRVERWMRCNACEATNTILMTPDQASATSSRSTRDPKSHEREVSVHDFDWTDKEGVRDLAERAVKSLRKKP